MAGITDLPFRQLVARFGAGLVVSEMVASQEMVHAKPGVREKAELGAGEDNTAVQLAGREARWMAEAARQVEARGARLIDINMGCPAKKVTSASGGGASGSALMKDLDHALTLIEAVAGAVSVPVTLKTRLGWNDNLRNAPELARRAEAAGVRMITIHGRTRCQFYKGRADWTAIAAVKEAVTIPVIANGDITGPRSAALALRQSGGDGVMIGGARGAGPGRWRKWRPRSMAGRRRLCPRAPRWPSWWPAITRRCWASTAPSWAAAWRASIWAGTWRGRARARICAGGC